MVTLKSTLSELSNFSEEESEKILSHFKQLKIGKKDKYLESGKICHQIAYIEKGSLIYLQTDFEGEQTAIDFAFEGEFVVYLQSFLNGTPADIDIMANEATLLQVISKERLNQLYEHYPKMERVGRSLLEEGLMKMAKGRTVFQTMNNQERYIYMMENAPQVLERIPQYHIATYLGIKPESLSRIRRNLMG